MLGIFLCLASIDWVSSHNKFELLLKMLYKHSKKYYNNIKLGELVSVKILNYPLINACVYFSLLILF